MYNQSTGPSSEFSHGIELLKKAYFSGSESLETQIIELNRQIEALSSRLHEHNKKTESNSAEIQELTTKNAEKERENKALAADIRKFKIENTRLSGARDYILNTFSTSPNRAEILTPYLSAQKAPGTVPMATVRTKTQPVKPYDRTQELINEIDKTLQGNIDAISPSSLYWSKGGHRGRNYIGLQQSASVETKAFSTEAFPEVGMQTAKTKHSGWAHEFSLADRGSTVRITQRKKTESHRNSKVKNKNEPEVEETEDFRKSPRSIQYIEGKRFFKVAREKLPFEKFNQLVKEIQKMSKNLQSKEDTLEACKEILGRTNKDLYTKLKDLITHKKM